MGFHPEWTEIAEWINRSRKLLIKKLSRNDCSWADDPSKHQAGFYVPASIQESRFFPELRNTNPEKPHIYDALIGTFWPSSGELRESALKHYSNKGTEYHCTRIPKDQFADLSPASLLLGGLLKEPVGSAFYWFIVIDSISPEAEIIEATFLLESNFHFGIFSPDSLICPINDEDRLIAELRDALKNKSLEQYVSRQALPHPSELASHAQRVWLTENGASSLNPYSLEFPGDAVMAISRDVEFAIYKRAELRQRAAQALALLTGGEDLAASVVHRFQMLDQIFLSAAQTRKSRAGLSFEHHIKRMLVDGRIRHEAQIPVGGRRPDFILPDVAELNTGNREALILSLKTTLRERWKQLGLERRHGAVFLATVDDRVSRVAVDEMTRNDIILVVPESLKKSKEAVYESAEDVITFRQFFDEEVKRQRPSLLLPAYASCSSESESGDCST